MSAFTLLVGIVGIAGWVLYFRERERSRDYATDLAQVIHDYPECMDSLRRSLNWEEIATRVDETNE